MPVCRAIAPRELQECIDVGEALLIRIVAPCAALVALLVLAFTGGLTEKSGVVLLVILAGHRAPIR